MLIRVLFILLLIVITSGLNAQSRLPLTHKDYDHWKEIQTKLISPDGRYAAFLIVPQEGDGRADLTDLRTGKTDSIRRASELQMSYDGGFAVCRIKPPVNQVREMRRLKKKKEDMPRDTLGIYNFTTALLTKVPDVRTFRMPARAGEWVAYTIDPAKTKDNASGKKKIRKNSEENGFTLTLRNLMSGKEWQFGYVREYVFDRKGQGLLFASSGNDSTLKSGVYWHNLKSGETKLIHETRPKYKVRGLSASENQPRVAFLVDSDTTKAQIRKWNLFWWEPAMAHAANLGLYRSGRIPADRLVGEHFTPYFSRSGQRLFFGLAPFPVVGDTTRLPEEIVQVEVWGTEDANIYPQQKVQLEQERKRSFLAVALLNKPDQPIVALGNIDLPSVDVADEGESAFALAGTDVPYRKMASWDLSVYHDVWLIDVNTGSRKKIAEKIKARPSLSPGGQFALWYSPTDTSWYTYRISDGKQTRINQGIRVSFADEEDDHPDLPNAYGLAGWTAGDSRVIIYDRYDLWSLDPAGTAPAVNLTQGRQKKTVYRHIRLDPDARFIDPLTEHWLSAFQEIDKYSGFARLSLKSGKLSPAVTGPARYAGLTRARLSDAFLFTRESFTEFPDVWTTAGKFTKPLKITNANPQQSRYRWGSVEMVSWTSPDGRSLAGLLYKPEGFSPDKKYPMITYFYERNSDELYAHHVPFPLRSSVNRTMYVSNGYLIFVPDIIYRVGYPGPSALDCITSGVRSLIAKGFVDEKNIGIQGHSWGGYQTAYIVTKTNMFKAAEAGAIVANMVSAYGGIRWETGLSRMFQYEKDQSRLGTTLWENRGLYLDNSPIFEADKINTPLLLLHNDADGAVPWYQGIEMYMALRRLGKPAWMLNYNGEPHWPVKRENRIDFQTRMMQFFDHYLKGAPAPTWMTTGVPALQKGVVTGY